MTSIKKKLMIIHHSGLLGGAGLSLESMLPLLCQEFDLRVYVPESPDAVFKRINSSICIVKTFRGRLGKITTYSGGNKFLSLRFVYHASKIPLHFFWWLVVFRKERPDIVIVNSRVLCWFSLIPFQQLSLCFVRETVDSESGFCENYVIKPLLKRFGARVFLSRYDRESHGFFDHASLVSPDFVEEGRFEVFRKDSARIDLEIPTSAFVICFVGGVDPLKGLPLLLRSIEHLKKTSQTIGESLRVVVCGDISASSLLRYKDAYDESDFDIVKAFLGRQSDNIYIKAGSQSDLSKIYSASDCVVLPMSKPHQARPAFEIGFFCGFPILPDFENVYEYYKDGYNAVIYRRNCFLDLASKIERLISEPELRCCLGKRNQSESSRIRSASYCLDPILQFIRNF